MTPTCPPPDKGVAAVTIASNRQLPLARVTAKSFLEHNAGIQFLVLLADRPDPSALRSPEPFRIVPLESLGMLRERQLAFCYNEFELSYALTPHFIRHLLAAGYERVVFLKQETMVLGSLQHEFELLERHPAWLTPHLLRPPANGNDPPAELRVLRAGVFNGGMTGFSRHDQALCFLSWWMERTNRGCYRDVERGVHFEQRWLDFAPALMPDCAILRDPGLNVGHWNILDRELKAADGGRLFAGERPCRVMRFSGYDPDRPALLSRYNPDLPVAATGAGASWIELYRRRLLEEGFEESKRTRYGFGTYDDGHPISDVARRIYHDLGEEALSFGDPFRACPGSFREWLGRPAAGGFPKGITNFWKGVHDQRADLQLHFGRWRGMARRFYPLWVRSYGKAQYGEGLG